MYTINETKNLPKLCLSNGTLMDINQDLLTHSIFQSLKVAENPNRLLALNICDKLMDRLLLCKKSMKVITLSEVQDMAQFVLMENGQYRAAREYCTTEIDNMELVY